MNWKHLNKLSDLATLKQVSENKLVAIFKHSTRCGVSRMVLKQFESDVHAQDLGDIDFYFLDLIRDIQKYTNY